VEAFHELIETRVAERSGMLRVLHDVTAILNESRTIRGALQRVLERIATHNGWCFGHVYLVAENDPNKLVWTQAYFEDCPGRFAEIVRWSRSHTIRTGEGLPGRVLQTGEAEWVTDLSEELAGRGVEVHRPDIRSAVAFPVKIEQDTLAVLEFLSDRELVADQRILDSMTNIGIQLGFFIVRKRMKRRIAELTTREQQRIGRDLHDDLGQQLTGVAMLAKGLERDLRDESSSHAPRASEIASGLREAQEHVRLLARGLVPVELDGRGLMQALADLARDSTKRYEIDVRFVPRAETLVNDSETATELYRIAQEAVTNAAKHGRATEIIIALSIAEQGMELEVTDNGEGISDGTIRKLGVGMSTMVYRANVIGGELSVERGPDRGTIVRCCVSGDAVSWDGGMKTP
jgi:signal transduction histidine kinase